MSAITPPRNLHACAQYQQIHGNRGLSTQFLQQQLVKKNVSDDRYFAYFLTPCAHRSHTARKGNWIAYKNNNQICLFDLITRKELWKWHVPTSAGKVVKVEVSDQGLVNVLTKLSKVDHQVQTIAQGTIISTYRITPTFESIPYLTSFQLKDVLRSEIGNLAMDFLKQNLANTEYLDDLTVEVCNQDFFVLIASPKPPLTKQAFVFDQHTQSKRIIDLETNIEAIPCATIFKNHLVFALTDMVQDPDNEDRDIYLPQIIDMELVLCPKSFSV